MQFKYHTELSKHLKMVDNFLMLTPSEEKFKQEILEIIYKHGSAQLHLLFQKVINPNQDIISIIKIANKSNVFFDFLHHDALQPFWQEAWRLMGKNPTSSDNPPCKDRSYHDMLPQNKIECITLVFGYIYYDEALKLRILNKTNYCANELEFLKKAASFHSFHAMNALNKHDLIILKSYARNKNSYLDLEKIVDRAATIAEYYGTPGYLVLSETCYSIAEYHKALGHEESITATLKQSIYYLKLADLALSNSAAEINNAYFGAGIAASNKFGFDTISKIKSLIIRQTGKYLTEDDINIAEHAAQIQFEQKENTSMLEATPLSY